MSLSDDLLEHAELLLGLDRRKPRQIHLRRAVSSAYYAIFHEILGGAARQALPHTAPAELREALGRSYGHTILKDGCKLLVRSYADQVSRAAGGKQAGQPMPRASRAAQRLCGGQIDEGLARISAAVVLLQEQRHQADYSMGATFAKADVTRSVDAARVAIEAHRNLSPNAAAALYLLLRTRDLRLG